MPLPASSNAPFDDVSRTQRGVVRYAMHLLVSAALLAWGTALTWSSGYEVHDADSRLYIAMSHELSQRPWASWCAPLWAGHWGREGLFVEHPPGLFWAGALLNLAGLPPYVALYVVNQVSWMLGVWLVFWLTRVLANERAAALATLVWCSSPAFIQYLVRGDQEHPLATSLVLGLVAAACLQTPWVVGCVWTLALGLAWSFKGLPALALLPLGFATARVGRRSPAVMMAMLFGTVAAGVYVWRVDAWYQTQTGHSFVAAYMSAQVGPSMGHGFRWLQKGLNVVYYAARPLWFAQPALGLVAYGAWRRFGRREPKGWGGFASVLGAGSLALFIAAFSMADRKADRYLFAAYPLVAMGAAVQLEALGGRARDMTQSVCNRPIAASALACFIAAMCMALKVYIGTYHYVFVRWWPGA